MKTLFGLCKQNKIMRVIIIVCNFMTNDASKEVNWVNMYANSVIHLMAPGCQAT
jgi:hypothetical protein